MSTRDPMDVSKTGWPKELDEEIDYRVEELLVSPEFKLFASTRLTLERAKFCAVQSAHLVMGHFRCWGCIEARLRDERRPPSQRTSLDDLFPYTAMAALNPIMTSEAEALGLTEGEIIDQVTPITHATMLALAYIATASSWNGAVTAALFLERLETVNGTGIRYVPVRLRDRLIDELYLGSPLLESSTSDPMDVAERSRWEDILFRRISDDDDLTDACIALFHAQQIHRAFYAGLAFGMRAIDG